MNKLKTIAFLALTTLTVSLTSAEPYNNLFRIIRPNGDVCVDTANKGVVRAQKNKAYPFGSKVATGADSSAVILFTETDAVRVMPASAVNIVLNNGQREVELLCGSVVTRISATATNDPFIVKTSLGTISSITGNCRISYKETAVEEGSDITKVLTATSEPSSKMKLVGAQYIIPILKNGNSAEISSKADDSYMVITDLLGDYDVYVNSGIEADPVVYEENPNLHIVSMSTKSLLKMWRKNALNSGRPIVSVFATNPTGKALESFAFAVGKSDVVTASNVVMEPVTNELDSAESQTSSYADTSVREEEDDASIEDLTAEVSGEDVVSEEESAPEAEAVTDDSGDFDFLF